MSGFKVAFDASVAETLRQADVIYQVGCSRMFADIVKRTPVDTGFARAAWWQSVGSVGSGNAPPVGFTTADSVFFANNAQYIERLEYGHSQQAPQGMVRITLAEANRYFQEAAAEAKSKGIA